MNFVTLAKITALPDLLPELPADLQVQERVEAAAEEVAVEAGDTEGGVVEEEAIAAAVVEAEAVTGEVDMEAEELYSNFRIELNSVLTLIFRKCFNPFTIDNTFV